MTSGSSVMNCSKAFLMMLDPHAKDFHFRVFIDVKGIPSHSRNFNGSFETHAEKFQSLNDQSRGIFVVINEGGQRNAEITRIRAVFADTDGAPLNPITETLEPHMVIKTSPGRWHVYWLVDDNFPLEMFRPVQTAIAEKFKTDASINDLSRVMRLPGFYHNKYDPYLCRLVTLDHRLPRYTLDQVVVGLGLKVEKCDPNKKALHQHDYCRNSSYSIEEVERALAYLDPFVKREQWVLTILALAHDYGEAGRELAHRWSRGDLFVGDYNGS